MSQKPTEKQPFEPSELVDHGDVGDLTETSNSGASSDGAQYS